MRIKINPAEIRNLAPMSATVSQLAGLMNDAHYGVNEISRLIELDGALTANVLRWANSAFYRSQFEIETVKSAVMRLGLNNIIKLAIGNSLGKTMKRKVPGYNLMENELWRHNVAAGLTIESLQRHTRIEVPSMAFTAAMLHDIGKLILSRHLEPAMVQTIRQEIETKHCSYAEAEQRLLNMDHAEVGAALSGYWKFPEEIITVIEQHHREAAAPNQLLDLVLFANYMAKHIGEGLGDPQQANHLDEKVTQRLGLSGDRQQRIEEDVKEKLSQALEEFEL